MSALPGKDENVSNQQKSPVGEESTIAISVLPSPSSVPINYLTESHREDLNQSAIEIRSSAMLGFSGKEKELIKELNHFVHSRERSPPLWSKEKSAVAQSLSWAEVSETDQQVSKDNQRLKESNPQGEYSDHAQKLTESKGGNPIAETRKESMSKEITLSLPIAHKGGEQAMMSGLHKNSQSHQISKRFGKQKLKVFSGGGRLKPATMDVGKVLLKNRADLPQGRKGNWRSNKG
eukprot:Gb_36262 [translate_table: standard]